MRVAIDGPAGSGKSTVAHALAKRCGLTLLDTGAMYRAVTLACLEREVSIEDADAVARVARESAIAFGVALDGSQTVSLDGRDVTSQIRTPEVDASVSAVSAIPAVRSAMVSLQRQMADTGDVVAEGRDIGTVVFPDAEVKVFLTADAASRAHRRAQQRNVAGEDQEQAILADLIRRDEADSTRETAPLRAAEDAYHMDSTSLTVDEEVARIVELMKAAKAKEATAVASPGNTSQSDGSERRHKGAKRAADNEPNDVYYDCDMRSYPLRYRALYVATMVVCGTISKVFWPWRLEGGERLWKAEGGQMVVMNHVSMLDPVVLVVSDWAHGRRMRPIYKSEFDKVGIAKWFFARVGAIPVKRGTADLKAVRRAQRALQRGEDILVFPEGTRIYSDDQDVTIHGGFALMAQLAKVPVLPVAIVGARDGAPGGNKPLRPGRVWMRVGDAISFDALGVKGRKKQAKAMEQLAMERVYALRDALRAAHPGKR